MKNRPDTSNLMIRLANATMFGMVYAYFQNAQRKQHPKAKYRYTVGKIRDG